MFEKILVPLDGSEPSQRALDIAIQIAKKFNGKIALIHVYSVDVRFILMAKPTTLTPEVPMITSTEYSKMVETIREAGIKILANGETKAKTEGVEVEIILKEGTIVQEIVKTAAEGKFDLIVMGARGMSKIKEMLLGSVSDGVIRNASCPVLVTK